MTALTLNASRKTKKTHIGELPVDWGVVRFGNIVESSQYGVSLEGSPTGRTPMLRMNNINGGRIDLSNLAYISVKNGELAPYLLKRDDLVFNRTNSLALVGKTAIFNCPGTYTFASYMVRFRIQRAKADPLFVNYFFNLTASRQRLRALATLGVSQCNINPTVLQKYFFVPLPPVNEQRQIAAILGVWDRAIERQEQLLMTKQQHKQALMQQLLTGKRRFPEFKGHRWQTVHLGDVFTERSEINRPDLPLVAITSDRGVIPRDQLDRNDTSSADKSKYLRIAPGDIGYNTMRMWQGVSGVSEVEGIVSPAYTVCIPQDGIDRYFASYLFKSLPVIHLFHRNSQGLVKDTLNLKFPNFARIKVTLPPIDEQKKITGVLRVMDQELTLLDREADALRDQKRGLMQKLLTGKVRVRA
jgi:type I restriction enzyme, S subunit